MSVSGQEIIDGHMSDFAGVIAGKGITPEFLACQLKRELHAKETKLVKIRSFPPKQSQEQDANVVDMEGPAVKRGRGKAAAYRTVYEGGIAEDTVIAVDMVNWGVRQAARIDAQKLLGAYPSEKVDHKHEGTVFVNTGIMRPMDDTPGQGIAVPGSSIGADTAAEVQK